MRPAWTLFLPLGDECILGVMARTLATEDPEELSAILAKQTDLTRYPVKLLFHALNHGAAFPPAGRLMPMEELDAVAASLAREPAQMTAYARNLASSAFTKDWQSLDWARAAVMAAVRAFDWKNGDGGAALARAFADVERAYLPLCYTESVRNEARPLPPMHRTGLYFVRAFDALDAGDPVGAVRALRTGLESNPDMGPMADYLLDDIQNRERKQAAANATPELRALAEQVRTLLSAYPEDDPAVLELKNSAVYQKVAYLLEA